MIIGIGVDLCDIERIKHAAEKDGFKKMVFNAEEIEYAERFADPAPHYAAAFAAKEALSKAGGWGLGRMGLAACFIRRTENGPIFVFTDDFSAKLKERNIKNAHLSISHESGMAVAMVVLEG